MAHKTKSTASNLSNLLPTGTVFAFQTLKHSLSNNGLCLPVHKYLVLSLIIFCSISCFVSSFTDSFTARNGKLYYGIATIKGLYVFNKDMYGDHEDQFQAHRDHDEEEGHEHHEDQRVNLATYRVRLMDFVHAFISLIVFLVLALSSQEVCNCFFSQTGVNGHVLIMNLPTEFGVAASFLFMLFPTRRRGIGHES
ncbi:hypothetical protein LWI28_011501 [Acer negundo]|uniref:Uncharacterized protein n=1 Tax=Acer negundo TaxID=4023 RepID=A0AAD5NZ04_ACENE|nr:hypothetical protein LWI28_011501 [Acer negundo]